MDEDAEEGQGDDANLVMEAIDAGMATFNGRRVRKEATDAITTDVAVEEARAMKNKGTG